MKRTTQVSLDQWQALVAVVETGGYAAAARRLNKSQSAVTYLIQQLEQHLGVAAFESEGRRRVLTTTGEMLYRQARALLDSALRLEANARAVSAGWEPIIRIAAEILFPPQLLLAALAEFSRTSPGTRIEVEETVLSGTTEALLARRVDLAITPHIPVGFLGDALATVKLIAAAHPDHPLHHLGRSVTPEDLAQHRHLLVRDSGVQRDAKATSLEVEQRWTFAQFETSIRAAQAGHGFAWYPEERLREACASNTLAPLPLREGALRLVTLYLVVADPAGAGPGTLHLRDIFQTIAADNATGNGALG
jgi:DNA-binding transcriptional LysR family regulator